MNNITCPRCRHRHPPNVTCEQAARRAQILRDEREKRKAAEAQLTYRAAVEDYNLAVEAVDARFGIGAADAILNLLARWNALGEINELA
jgi:predicted metal-dependent hydrolase